MTENNLVMLALAVGLVGWIIVQQVVTIRVSLRRIWTIPVLLGIYTFTQLKPEALNDYATLLVIGVALVAGGLVGLMRGSLNRLEVDGSSGQLVVRGSVVGLVVWLVFVAGEVVLRFTLNGGSFSNGSSIGTLVPLALVTGMFAGWRFVWYLKYVQLSRYY